jgi:uncharacterized protein YjiK
MIIKNIFFFCVLLTSLAQCQNSAKKAANEKLNTGFLYNINQPDQAFEMPSGLQEISALSLAEDGNLLTLNDEIGKIFKINKTTGKIVGEYLFKPEGGDFEGIEMVGNTVYASTSKGSIYAISNYLDSTKRKVEKFTNEALRGADMEGLGYDPTKKTLLLTCKGARGNATERELWAFDINAKTYSSAAIFTISLAQMEAWVKSRTTDNEVAKELSLSKDGEFNFGASAFAVHPINGNFYFLSSPGKLLVVTNAKGEIQNILKLDKKIHPQPEGMAFDKDGTLYISNEGKKEHTPKIYQFKMQGK